MELVDVTPKYYEFIRFLRTHSDNAKFFIEQVEISELDQIKYMEKHGKDYYVCLLYDEPVGYIGVIDNDIRICTHPNFKGRGIGKFMLQKIKDMYPSATAKIKKDNIASQKLFTSCNVPYKLI